MSVLIYLYIKIDEIVQVNCFMQFTCSHIIHTEKPLIFSNKFFSIYNYLFVSFLYSVFNEHFRFAERNSWKLKVESWRLLHFSFSIFHFQLRSFASLVGPSGLEPPTSCLSGTRSNLLSYEPMWCFFALECENWKLKIESWRLNSHLTHFSFSIFHFQLQVTDLLGGDDGIRTHDPLLAEQVLSQLSYTPVLVASD